MQALKSAPLIIKELFMPKPSKTESDAQIADIDMLIDPPEISPAAFFPALKDILFSPEELPYIKNKL